MKCLVSALMLSGNRGSGCVRVIEAGLWGRRQRPAGPYPDALIARRPTVAGYDPGVSRPGLARVGEADIWHAVRTAIRKMFFVREFVQAVRYFAGWQRESPSALTV